MTEDIEKIISEMSMKDAKVLCREVYIPAEMGYGKISQPGIPSGSTLIFEIELLGIA